MAGTGSRQHAHLLLVILGNVRMLGVAGGRDLDQAVGGRHQRGSCPRAGPSLPGARQNRLPERLQLLQLADVDRLGLVLALVIQPILYRNIPSGA